MTFTEAIGVLISAADARRQQWQGLVDYSQNPAPIDAGKPSPADLIDELWEVWGNMELDDDDTEAQDLANEISEAIRVVRKIYPAGGTNASA